MSETIHDWMKRRDLAEASRRLNSGDLNGARAVMGLPPVHFAECPFRLFCLCDPSDPNRLTHDNPKCPYR